MDQELKQMFERKGAEISVPSTLSPELRSRVGRKRMIMGGSIAAAAAAVVVTILSIAGSPAERKDVAPAVEDTFVGTWVTTDGDASGPTLFVRASGEDAYEIVVRDDDASVCSGASSTMTGTGRLDGTEKLVIPTPIFTCNDGSKPKSLNGPPLEQQLRNLTFVHNPEADTLTDSFGSVWDRGVTAESSGGMWPQSNLNEVQQAQRLADEGDPRYTWQVLPEWPPYSEGRPVIDPGDAEIFTRFLEEKLGWEEFSWGVGPRPYPPEDWPWQFVVVRCAPGASNAMYPNDPDGRECAPTLDDNHYETVRISADSPVRDSSGEVRASGIWVVTRWSKLQPSAKPITGVDDFFKQQIRQVPPPSDAEATELLSNFLQARVDGEGAEEYLAPSDEEVPVLYASDPDVPYERFEFELNEGPVWPGGWMEYNVRLFAEGGSTVVEQPFIVDRDGTGRLVLVFGNLENTDILTTVNGEPLGEPYSILGGEVTFAVPPPWYGFFDYGRDTIALVHPERDANFAVLPDPLPVEKGCRAGPTPADAEELAQTIRSDPDVEATEPVATTVGGVEALRMDVVMTTGASVCDYMGTPLVLRSAEPNGPQGPALTQGDRMRLYLLDLPGGSSARILSVAFVARESSFETMLEDEARIIDSFEFHTP